MPPTKQPQLETAKPANIVIVEIDKPLYDGTTYISYFLFRRAKSISIVIFKVGSCIVG